MRDYFDTLVSRNALNLFAPEPEAQPAVGSESPLPAFMQLGQPVAAEPQPQPQMQMQPPQPQQQQQPMALPQATVNPFDDLDSPAVAPTAANPAGQAPAQPTVDPKGNASTAAPLGGTPTAFADPEKAEKFRADIAQIINSGGTRDDVAKRAAIENVNVADMVGLDEALAYVAKTGKAVPVGLLKPKQAPDTVEYHGADNGGFDAGVAGALDSVSLGSADEIGGALSATGNSIAGVFGGGDGKSWTESYAENRDANRQRLSDSEHYHGKAYLGGQIVGGLATLPLGGEGLLARGGLAAAGRIAAEGALLGGAYGFDSGTGDIGSRALEGLKGAAAGAGAGLVLGVPLNSVARRIAANRATDSAGREVLNAADNLNRSAPAGQEIRPLVGHTSDGGLGSMTHALLEPTITGGRVSGLAGATRRFTDAAAGAHTRIANEAAGGVAADIRNVAEHANNPARPGSLAAYRDELRQGSTANYGRAEALAGDARLATSRTINAIDAKLAEWRETPGGVAGMEALETLRENLANGRWTVAGLRRLRTSFGDNIDSTNRTVREAANELWGPLSNDIQRELTAQGRGDAARAYRQADREYADGLANLDVIDSIVGRPGADLSPDAVATRLLNMSQRDYGRLGRAMRAVSPAQANEIRGGVVRSLGLANPAHQNVAQEVFSLPTFATRWNKMSPQAKGAVLDARTVTDLNDLARLAGSQRNIDRLGNSSRSGVFSENYRTFAKTWETMAAWMSGVGDPTTLAAMGGSVALGRVLATSGVARAVVRASESRSIEVLSRRLSEAARRYPAAAQDILNFRSAMSGEKPKHAVTVPQRDDAPVPNADPNSAIFEDAPAPEASLDAPAMDQTDPNANPFDDLDG